MKYLYTPLIVIMFTVSCTHEPTNENSYISNYTPIDKELYYKILEMDSIYFSAYNNCDIETQDSIYSEDLEFYHDKNGLRTSKQELLASIKNNICGKIRRELLNASVEVYPIKNFGAIQIGLHRFYNINDPNSPPTEPGKFVLFWKNEGDSWKITRVVSLH
ncbi:hypothetical protein Aoki45_23760 [Algoriphagus sp. oki45]|uniref:nuclear transport factor 2 family protein n=1 Tax=Algoriphagus sp. oki45 TaxID=3067294 RepID=UPI0027EBF19B|nr:hypothetical protein Aoki45_23760 [Algoriphagus sp. oki45]